MTDPACSGSLAGPLSYDRRTPPPFRHHYRHAFASWPCTKSLGTTTVRSHTPEPQSPPRGGEWGWERPPSDLRIYSPETGSFRRRFRHVWGRSQPAPAARLIPAGRSKARPPAGPSRRPVILDRRVVLAVDDRIEAAAVDLVGQLPDVVRGGEIRAGRGGRGGLSAQASPTPALLYTGSTERLRERGRDSQELSEPRI